MEKRPEDEKEEPKGDEASEEELEELDQGTDDERKD